MVLKDPERYAYYEEMRVVLWEGMVFSQDNMTQMISRARKNIRIFPELEIKNIPGTGYQLYIRTEEEVKEFLAKQTKNEEKESA
ncbi:MAG: hypothetical protein LUG51_15855 [Tannerellaceae bacterium]|nr:hypothetical protein [Tannerellaceae bacterium]